MTLSPEREAAIRARRAQMFPPNAPYQPHEESLHVVFEDFRDLLAELDRLRRRIEDLTPGGSEFAGNPDRCLEWVRSNLDSRLQHAVSAHAEVNRLRDVLAEAHREVFTASIHSHTRLIGEHVLKAVEILRPYTKALADDAPLSTGETG